MQVIDQPESFNLLNTLLFNIPGSHGAAYSGSCAQVSPEIPPTFRQRRSFMRKKVLKIIYNYNDLNRVIFVLLSLVSVLQKTVIVVEIKDIIRSRL